MRHLRTNIGFRRTKTAHLRTKTEHPRTKTAYLRKKIGFRRTNMAYLRTKIGFRCTKMAHLRTSKPHLLTEKRQKLKASYTIWLSKLHLMRSLNSSLKNKTISPLAPCLPLVEGFPTAKSTRLVNFFKSDTYYQKRLQTPVSCCKVFIFKHLVPKY